MKRLGVLAALVIAATFVASAGGGTAKTDLSTRAGVVSYLVQHGIDPTGIVIQRGARNYAGPACPGRGWTCTHASRVVQLSTVTATYQCTASAGGVVAPPNTCTIVQISTTGNNVAKCVETSAVATVAQSCNIQQQNTSGQNNATVQQTVNVGNSPATNVSQAASVSQTNGSGSNASSITQNIQQTSAAPAVGTTTQSQEGHQSANVSQTTTTGDNSSNLTQSLAQNANSKIDNGNLTQSQNASSNGPNSDAQVTESSTLGHNESHLNQTNTLSMQSHKRGNITQTQGSDAGGLNGHVDQLSGGVSLAFNTQNESQTMTADPSTSLTQVQFGPSFCCTNQQGNPADVFQIGQTSTQSAGNGASQSNAVVGTCITAGNCTGNQSVTQNGNTTTNGCSGSSCNTGVVCGPGTGCQPCGTDVESGGCPGGSGGTFTLTVVNNSTNGADTVTGFIGDSSAVINCQPAPNNSGCTAQLPAGTGVELFANGNCGDWGPNSFWTGVDTQDGNVASLTMDENRNVTANYVPDFSIC